MMPRDYTGTASSPSVLEEKVGRTGDSASRLLYAPGTSAGVARSINATPSAFSANSALIESLIAREQMQQQHQQQQQSLHASRQLSSLSADPLGRLLLQRSLNQQQLALSAAAAQNMLSLDNLGLGFGLTNAGLSALNSTALLNGRGLSNSGLSQLLSQQQLLQQAIHLPGSAGGALVNVPICEKRKGRTGTFPRKLHLMLSELEKQDGGTEIASFLPHGRAFAIHDSKEFVKSVMPKYFRMSRFSSFQRQLNLYDFQRVTEGPDKGSYFHELFVKGRPARKYLLLPS